MVASLILGYLGLHERPETWRGSRRVSIPVIPGLRQQCSPGGAFAHALALAALHGPAPGLKAGYPLPDEDPARPYLMVGSVLDGIRTHHFGDDPDTGVAARIADLVADLVTGAPSLQACAGLHAGWWSTALAATP